MDATSSAIEARARPAQAGRLADRGRQPGGAVLVPGAGGSAGSGDLGDGGRPLLAGFRARSRIPGGRAAGRACPRGTPLVGADPDVRAGLQPERGGHVLGRPAVPRARASGAWRRVGGVASRWTWVVSIIGFAAIAYFPDGKLPAPRWRLAPLALAVAGWVIALGNATDRRIGDYGIPSPLPGPRVNMLAAVSGGMLALGVARLIGCLACIVVKFRRADGMTRRQIGWYGYGYAVTAIVLAIAVTTSPPSRPPAIAPVTVAAGAGVADPEVPPVRHRPGGQPDARLGPDHRSGDRDLLRLHRLLPAAVCWRRQRRAACSPQLSWPSPSSRCGSRSRAPSTSSSTATAISPTWCSANWPPR